jgi:DNA repair exonuclease SbcCD nuclease subunit
MSTSTSGQQQQRILAIGDPHFRMDNLDTIETYITNVCELVRTHRPDVVVVLGDLLHCHERLHTSALNYAYTFIDTLRQLCPVYVIVGNHDYINNSQFLSTHHWMNAMKQWPNVTIVDRVIRHGQLAFCPYVFPGRLREALATLGDVETGVDSASILFCHQEFKGCKMGAIVSTDGDEWTDASLPYVVSGHIHDKQRVGDRVYYAGSSMQHAFGESHDKTIALCTIHDKGHVTITELDTHLPKKRILYMSIDEARDDTKDYAKHMPNTQLRITLNGTYEEFKAFKKTNKYKELQTQGIKLVYRMRKNEAQNEAQDAVAKNEGKDDATDSEGNRVHGTGQETFYTVLHDLVRNDADLLALFNRCMA